MKDREYTGFETGPIRPPSEAESLLLRITRNCPWNKCTFCGLYKGEKFSVRPIEHIKHDIDQIKTWTDYLLNQKAGIALRQPEGDDPMMVYMAENWLRNNMRSVFLQDANSLVVKPEIIIEILQYLRANFPRIERITSYARSHTVARISEQEMSEIAAAGLNRIHIGLESGSDEVLRMVQKGSDKNTHIEGGRRVKKAGIELSEYYIPGLGGRRLSKTNAVETADALNRINPDFIRIRTLAVSERIPLAADYANGSFIRTNDVEMAEEILLMLKNLDGINSYVKSDHIVNLLPEVNGPLPEDRDKMISVIEQFLNLSEEDQMIYRIGRRTGRIMMMRGMENEEKKQSVLKIIYEAEITKDNIDEVCDKLISQYI